MIKIAIAYVLLIASFAGPPLLFITVPVVFLMTRNYLRKRRAAIELAVQVSAEKRTEQVVRYFR